MSILITADLHLSENPRDAYRHAFMRTLPALLEKHKASMFLCLGDLTEVKDRHDAALTNAVARHFHAIAEVCPVVINPGNHDWLSGPDNPFFAFLGRIKGVYWVRGPTSFDSLPFLPVATEKAIGRGAILLPHTPNPARDWEKLDFREYDWAFAHQSFAGATSNGHKLNGTSLSIFPPKLKIIAGDIHEPQDIDNLTYVGSPYRVDFGDSFEPRLLLLEANGKLRSIPCEGPQKRLIIVNSMEDLSRVKEANKGDVLKVRFETNMEEHASWGAFAEKVRAWGAKNGYSIEAVQPLLTDKAARMSNTAKEKKVAAKTDEQLLDQYAGARGVDAKTLAAGKRFL